jgi:hypothetical protein
LFVHFHLPALKLALRVMSEQSKEQVRTTIEPKRGGENFLSRIKIVQLSVSVACLMGTKEFFFSVLPHPPLSVFSIWASSFLWVEMEERKSNISRIVSTIYRILVSPSIMNFVVLLSASLIASFNRWCIKTLLLLLSHQPPL